MIEVKIPVLWVGNREKWMDEIAVMTKKLLISWGANPKYIIERKLLIRPYQLRRYNLIMDDSECGIGGTRKQTAEDLFPQDSPLSHYNVAGSYRSLEEDTILHIIHEISHPDDVVQFLLSNSSISRTMSNQKFAWSLSRAASSAYSLQTIPSDKVLLVWRSLSCTFITLGINPPRLFRMTSALAI